MSSDPRPIGVFDSGVGGLTVLKALMARLPDESTVYLGDTARVPYGTKSAEVVTRYSQKNAAFLIEQGIKLLVVACNTASSVALPHLTSTLSVPVIGVIEPGADAAAAASRSGKIGVIGTQGTIRSGAYQRALLHRRADAEIHVTPCPLFVPLVEEGWTGGDVPMQVAREYLGELSRSGVDTLVLGCTHYPLLKDVIGQVMGSSVTLVDSAEATAEAVSKQLVRAPVSAPATHRYFLTDVPEKFPEIATRFLGRRVEHAEQIDLRFG